MSVLFADSLARFVFYQIASRFGSFIEKSRRETEGFLCDSNPLGRSEFRGNIPRQNGVDEGGSFVRQFLLLWNTYVTFYFQRMQ